MTRRRRAALLILAALLVALAAAWGPAASHLRAAALLVRFSDPGDDGALARLGRHEVDVEALALAFAGSSRGPGAGVPARLYRPRGADAGAPAVVLLHGVHHLGIDEPRLVRFARAIAQSGLAVLTPELEDLKEFRIEPEAILTIGAAVDALWERRGRRPVGVMGLSFAGGLGLIAAADPRWADKVGWAVAIGAHHDLARVLRFFATDRIARPDGTALRLQAHDYGPLVLAAGHPEALFGAVDAPEARKAATLWLRGDADGARRALGRLTPQGRARLEALFARRVEAVSSALPEALPGLAPALAPVSPRGRLAGMKAPCFLLHGTQDNVIPASETEWLARELPAGRARAVLLSPAIVHVELGEVSLRDRLALVRFLARLLATARGT